MGIGDLIVVLSLAVLGIGSAAGAFVGIVVLVRSVLARQKANETAPQAAMLEGDAPPQQTREEETVR